MSELELELESFDLDAYIDIDAIEAIAIKIFYAFYIPGACWSIYGVMRYLDFYDMFTFIPRELWKEFKNGPAKKLEDPSRARNHSQGLKHIGQAYIGETYIVSRHGVRH